MKNLLAHFLTYLKPFLRNITQELSLEGAMEMTEKKMSDSDYPALYQA